MSSVKTEGTPKKGETNDKPPIIEKKENKGTREVGWREASQMTGWQKGRGANQLEGAEGV